MAEIKKVWKWNPNTARMEEFTEMEGKPTEVKTSAEGVAAHAEAQKKKKREVDEEKSPFAGARAKKPKKESKESYLGGVGKFLHEKRERRIERA